MSATDRPPRTELERLIRDRRQTLEEFGRQADKYAVRHGLKATLSPRHLQRLASVQRADGRPLGPVRPATRKLLEMLLGRPIEELLGPPHEGHPAESTDTAAELRACLAASRTVDSNLVRLFQDQVNLARIVDRRLGGVALLTELREHIAQMQHFLRHTLNSNTRVSLACVLVDGCALAAWIALDRGAVVDAWILYDQAKTAARESESPALEAYACAGQSTVLLDVGEWSAAVELTAYARTIAHDSTPRLLRSWLAGSHGEALAANGERSQSLHAFDDAARLLSSETDPEEVPFLVFNDVHLARWRGNALSRLGERDAVDVLSSGLERLDRTFVRAEAALHADLGEIFLRMGEHEAATVQAERCLDLARQIGSVRNGNRARRLLTTPVGRQR